MKITRTILAATAAAACLLPALGVANANAATAKATPSVTIVGNTYGVTMHSQHANSDGSVTSTWENRAGQGFTYAGSPGAQISLTPAQHTVAGKTVHTLQMSVTLPGTAKSAIVADAAAYAASGRSVLKDALNSGADPATAKARLSHAGVNVARAAGIRPMSTGDNSIYSSWCVTPISGDAGNAKASGCVTRYLVQNNGGGDFYVSDDMEGLASDSNDWADELSGFKIWMDYTANNVVMHWIPDGQSGTDCHDISAGATFGIASFTSTNTICGGSISTLYASNTSGLAWSGYTTSQVGLEPIDEVHSPANASIGNSVLHLSMTWS